MQRQPILSERDLSLFQLRTRYVRNYLTFAGKNSKDFLLYLSGPGVYDSPQVDMELTSVPGKNGDIIRENAKRGQRRYKNLDITYKAFFFDALPSRTASVKSWLLSPVGYQVLHDTYDPDFFRMATCKEALAFEVSRNKGASMELKFHCQPQRWSIEGQRKVRMDSAGVLLNPYEFPSKPIIRAYGSGEAKLYVGSKLITIQSIDGYVDLNCETHNAYNASGFCNHTSHKRVAAYCRVSTDDPNQTSSFELQKNHYEEYIKEHRGWELVGIYADEGISGTSLAHREEFNRMMNDCTSGKIDMIVTKSISRFARNTVDAISAVRKLAQLKHPVGVLFETENLYTLDQTSEIILTVPV